MIKHHHLYDFFNQISLTFAEKIKLGFKELDSVDSRLVKELKEGEKNGFGTGLPIVVDNPMRNFFVLGRTKNKKLVIAVIDQGKQHIKGLGNRLRKNKINLA